MIKTIQNVILLLITLHFMGTNGIDICNMILKHPDAAAVLVKLYRELAFTEEMRNDIQLASRKLLDLPEKVIYMNKFALILALNKYIPLDSELASYAIRLMDDIPHFYRIRSPVNAKKIEKSLKSRLDEITAAIAADPSFHGPGFFSTSEILRCMRSNNLVTYTLNILEKYTSVLNTKLSRGAKMYKLLLSLVESSKFYVESEPSEQCRLALMRLIKGCTGEMFVSDPTTETTDICSGFCTNALRGCFARPLLSSLSIVQQFPRDGFDQSTFDTSNAIKRALYIFLNSMNGTWLGDMINTALLNTRKDGPQMKLKLGLFCGGASRENESTTVPNTTPLRPATPSVSQTMSDEQQKYYLEKLEQQQNEILKSMQTIEQHLGKVAAEFANVSAFMEKLEQRYCGLRTNPDGVESNCWNGQTFDKYTKPVMPFTVEGQKLNPEMLMSDERALQNPSDWQQNYPSVGDPKRVGMDYNTDRTMNDALQSSGMYPDDIDFPTDLRTLPGLMPIPEFPIANNAGLSDDDEDKYSGDIEDYRLPNAVQITERQATQVTSAQMNRTSNTESRNSRKKSNVFLIGSTCLLVYFKSIYAFLQVVI